MTGTYEQYHAIIKDALERQVLAELRALVAVPEYLLLGTILARIDDLENEQTREALGPDDRGNR